MKTFLSLTLLAALAATGCKPSKAVEQAEPGATVSGDKVVIPPKSPQLNTLGVERAEVAKRAPVRLNGRLTWDENVTVRVFTPFAGRVMQILVEPGQTVKKGDTLALIASSDYGQAQADARKADGDFLLAERTLNRVQELLKHGAAAQKDLESAQADYARTQSELQRASARLAFYGGNTNGVDQTYQLRSPSDGVVVEKNLTPGQEVRPDQMLAGTDRQAAPLFTVTDPSRLWIQLDAADTDLSLIQTGQEFELHARAFPEEKFTGRVDMVSDFLDPATRTIRVRGSVDNSKRRLKAEMFMTAELGSGTPTAGTDVPAKAVFLMGEKHFLFVEENRGEFVRREVKAGPEHDGKVLVLEGLRPGQNVVTEGSLLLQQMLQTPQGS